MTDAIRDDLPIQIVKTDVAELGFVEPSGLTSEEIVQLVSDDSNESPPTDIVAYNELRSCADLHRMHGAGDLDIQPAFQRDVVWRGTDQTRFIDSLIKQLPIPSMCFAYDYKKGRWIVIDGLQRISTIIKFLDGGDWKLSVLPDIDPELSGKSVSAIKTSRTSLRQLYTRVQNQTIPINVLRCDFDKKSHNEYLFTIFHRLNAGGVKLNNQEIRNCIYEGSFNLFLKEADANADWRRINNMGPGQNYRFIKQEAILRFFAFMESRSSYKGSVSRFLNDYMFANRNMLPVKVEEKRQLFGRAVKLVSSIFPAQATPPRMPGTVLEAILIGVATNIDALENETVEQVRTRYAAFRDHPSVSEESLKEGLSKKDKVDARIDAAIAIFARPQ